MQVALLPFTAAHMGARIGRPLMAGILCLALAALLATPSSSITGTIPMATSGLSAPLESPAVSVPSPNHNSPQVSILPGDWPQLQRDPQHTGYSPQEVRPPYRYYWRWNQAPFASRTQPVVAAGTLFIGSLDGRMYALDADQDANGGAPTILWTTDVGSPIRHSAAVYGGYVYFGAQDGHVYALDTALGGVRWTFLADGAIVVAPAVGNGAVFFGSSGGSFYALDATSGQVRWSYFAGAPILTSAALSADEKTVYLGAENLYAYALNTDTGNLIWKTRLQGQSLADRWPVVAGSNVIFRSQSLQDFHLLLHEGDDAMDSAGAVRADWDADWAVVRPRIVTYLSAKPDRQTFFVLNTTTGALRGPAPVLYTYGNADPPDPPVAKDGLLYLRYRARHGIQTDGGSGHVTTRYDAELGRMNLTTLDITGLRASQSFTYQFRSTSDEPSMLSIGGNLLYVDSWERLGALDLQTGALISIANVADDWMACPPASTPPSPPASGGQCPIRAGPLPFFREPWPFPGPQVGEGFVHRSLVIAAERLFWRVESGGLASIGHSLKDAESTTETDDAPASDMVNAPSLPEPPKADVMTPEDTNGPLSAAQDLSSYVWTEPIRPVANPPADLVEQLAYQVQQIVNTNAHLLPFLLERGFTTFETFPTDPLYPEEGIVQCRPGNSYWFDPGELVYTLSIAYPYLSSDLQSRVRAYLTAEMGRYPPLERVADGWLTDGVRRESYEVTVQPNCWPLPVPPITTLYALWAYARYTGDWRYVQDRWAGIDALFDDRKGAVDTYASISGAIGYARIAQHLNRTEAAEGQRVAVNAMTAGLNFASFLNAANVLHPDPRDRYTGLRAPVFFGLTPEVGRYLSDTNRTAAMAYLNDLTAQDGVFLWYLTRLGIQAELGESSFHGPDLAWSVFLARAYVEGADRSTLRPYLDRPWGLGDLYHIQKLVATIEASGTTDTTPPVISDVSAGNITFYSARISWVTDEPATRQVEYGPTAAYGSTSPLQPALLTAHTVTLTSLRPSRLYHYRVCSVSPGGKSCSTDRTLTTAKGREVFVPTVARRR